jgi:hypothetical protein
MTASGTVDIAFDTSLTGTNIINESSATASYIYRRRIGTLYISHKYGTVANEIVLPFVGVLKGSDLIIQYKNLLELDETDTYVEVSRRFQYTYVPPNTNLIGNFTYKDLETTNRVYTSAIPASGVFINSSGMFSIPMTTTGLITETLWDFDHATLYCIGYTDGRN